VKPTIQGHEVTAELRLKPMNYPGSVLDVSEVMALQLDVNVHSSCADT